MKIKENAYVAKKKNGEVWSNLSGEWKIETDEKQLSICLALISIAKKRSMPPYDKECEINRLIERYQHDLPSEELDQQNNQNKVNAIQVCEQLINFFKDFNFEPNFRFINTLQHNCSSYTDARNYVVNYFALTDNQFQEDVNEKTKSQEFSNIITNLQKLPITKNINSRFRVFYGSQGTGKTTEGKKIVNDNIIVCHSAMLPSDLLEDFKFENGQPSFKKSALWNAMENGQPIMLDEMNLLPFESLRFLQGILDDKSSIIYKGQTINIKEGFQIICTMNLKVNGNTFNLPEPLVDRACELKKFTLTAEQLMGALL